ncbi:glycine cleavage system aminomethyltransferase GcvT [Actinokineospora globicatena]|uniref:Aminomethyltransferase n=1 Tax=Actinokineospora globicatena TaxID=103729 RepID=A0A9W6V6W5_9PSEU|nr:glycine cleavage system aminomethyltransferase GcvT [Actinokineospora globicatena]MCP2304457.1 aminomethyltransferase [Actinokineospora globicatena]GLW78177.1 aminomethyltransferase [Actinokineospora globicatena]GLW85157.1 aminomethyltransferase [Actinokineospora globicatena]GLW90782.1 aminomethyltransferase [Actinokineospora globicatena]
MSTPSPLHSVHEALGASFTDFAGWSMPLRYGSELAEHKAVRTASGLFDLSHMGEIELTGPEAAQALDFALVGKLSAVKPGKARYTMICDAEGGVLDDLVVYRLAADKYMVVANASNAATVAAALRERAEGFAVEVNDRSAELALIAVQGPTSTAIIGSVTDADLDALAYYASVPSAIGGIDVLLARTGYTGEDGFEVYVDGAQAPRIWELLTEAGQEHGLLPAGLACRDTLRLEAGMPLYGNELSASFTPFDAGLGRVVKFEKPGGFVGKEALERRRDADVETKVLVGLVGSGKRAPRHGYAVVDAEGTQVGTVTSGALSPTLGHPIAMAYVPVAVSEPGTALSVDIRGTSAPVEVVKLPFYQRQA